MVFPNVGLLFYISLLLMCSVQASNNNQEPSPQTTLGINHEDLGGENPLGPQLSDEASSLQILRFTTHFIESFDFDKKLYQSELLKAFKDAGVVDAISLSAEAVPSPSGIEIAVSTKVRLTHRDWLTAQIIKRKLIDDQTQILSPDKFGLGHTEDNDEDGVDVAAQRRLMQLPNTYEPPPPARCSLLGAYEDGCLCYTNTDCLNRICKGVGGGVKMCTTAPRNPPPPPINTNPPSPPPPPRNLRPGQGGGGGGLNANPPPPPKSTTNPAPPPPPRLRTRPRPILQAASPPPPSGVLNRFLRAPGNRVVGIGGGVMSSSPGSVSSVPGSGTSPPQSQSVSPSSGPSRGSISTRIGSQTVTTPAPMNQRVTSPVGPSQRLPPPPPPRALPAASVQAKLQDIPRPTAVLSPSVQPPAPSDGAGASAQPPSAVQNINKVRGLGPKREFKPEEIPKPSILSSPSPLPAASPTTNSSSSSSNSSSSGGGDHGAWQGQRGSAAASGGGGQGQGQKQNQTEDTEVVERPSDVDDDLSPTPNQQQQQEKEAAVSDSPPAAESDKGPVADGESLAPDSAPAPSNKEEETPVSSKEALPPSHASSTSNDNKESASDPSS